MDLAAPVVALYDSLVARLSAAPGFPLPDRRYVTAGLIAYDCEQFVVTCHQLYGGRPGLQQPGPIIPTGGILERSIDMEIVHLVCAPKGAPIPTRQQLDASGRSTLKDASTVLTAVFDGYYANEWRDPCTEASIGPAVLIGPEGGFTGVSITVTVQQN